MEENAVGFVVVELHRPERNMGKIHMLAVDPDYQGGGVGTALTEFALDRLREAGMAVAMVDPTVAVATEEEVNNDNLRSTQ